MVRPEIVDAFRAQIGGCRKAGSELTARLMERCVAELESGGPLARLLSDWQGVPLLDALPQRVLGAVQGIALEGRAPELERFYPSLGGTPVWPDTADAFARVLERHAAEIRPRLDTQVQTNEVRRCAPLLGGFLAAARAAGGLPLRLLEIGSSAGLLLFWERYRYELGPHRWGDPASRVRLDAEWRGAAPDLGAPARVASRLGCDLYPLDLRDPAQLRRIESFLWADQPDRHQLLRAAAAALPSEGAPLERIGASAFLARELATPAQGVATVVFQSHMWWYLPKPERQLVTSCVESAGARARADAPLFWLSMEAPNVEYCEIRLRAWPGDSKRAAGAGAPARTLGGVVGLSARAQPARPPVIGWPALGVSGCSTGASRWRSRQPSAAASAAPNPSSSSGPRPRSRSTACTASTTSRSARSTCARTTASGAIRASPWARRASACARARAR